LTHEKNDFRKIGVLNTPPKSSSLSPPNSPNPSSFVLKTGSELFALAGDLVDLVDLVVDAAIIVGVEDQCASRLHKAPFVVLSSLFDNVHSSGHCQIV
jgi:hypothetical protein